MEMSLLVEREVKDFLERAYHNAKTILMNNSEEIHVLANALLEHETLAGSQIKVLLSRVGSGKMQHEQKLVVANSLANTAEQPPNAATMVVAKVKAQ
ncbi:hypothetical protein OROHE_019013 [Orobanche hederae]